MSGMFAPDDDRDEDEGWDSMEDYLEDRGDDMESAERSDGSTAGDRRSTEYPDSTPDGVQTDRVDVDPKLFGEWPDGEIEVVEDDGNGLVSGRTQHEWEREALIVEMTGACPSCDAEVSKKNMRSPTGDVIVKRSCSNCGEQWITNKTKGFTGSV